MLELQKGKSTKFYENDFFREFATDLTTVFEMKQWEGLLMGMPECLSREDLQIDCLLLTNDQVIIIDFKNYSGDLVLPDETEFDYGKWILNSETIVKGGNSINPYKQLGKQRAKLRRLLENNIINFDRKSISTLVCFQGVVNIIGNVPQKVRSMGFDIVDTNSIYNKITDIVDVENQNRQFLNLGTKQIFNEKLFKAPSYNLSEVFKPTTEDNELESINEISSNRQQKNVSALSEINSFLTNDNKALIISGNTKSGKTSLIPSIIDLAHDNGYVEATVFTYSNRLKRKMQRNHPTIEEINSLFGTIFDFQNEEIDENFKKVIPIICSTEQTDDVGEEIQRPEVFIIDDSQLISNSYSDSDRLRFGTGFLLDDIFSYLDLENHPKRKVIFIGDKNQISYGSSQENTLNKAYLSRYLENRSLSHDISELVLPANKEKNEIIRVCNNISSCIEEKQFNNLTISDAGNIKLINRDGLVNLLVSAYKHPKNAKFLVYSNRQANDINQWIKNKLAKTGEQLGVNDYIMFNSSINAFEPKELVTGSDSFLDSKQSVSFDELKRVDNGSFGQVISVDKTNIIEHSFNVEEESLLVSLIPCQVKIDNGDLLSIFVIDNFLVSQKSDRYSLINRLIKQRLNHLMTDFLSRNKFEDSQEYQAMIKKGGNYFVKDEDKYRLVSDKRKTPKEYKNFKKRMKNKLIKDRNSEYFKWYHAARISYGWAITVNKAMAHSFEEIYLNTSQENEQIKINSEYLKWLYTGISIADHSVSLINWQPITPFTVTRFNNQPSGNAPKKKEIIYTFTNETDKEQEFYEMLSIKLKGSDWKINSIFLTGYLITISLEKDTAILELFFDFTAKNEVSKPRLKKGSESDFNSFIEIISKEIIEEERLNMSNVPIYSHLLDLFELLKVRGISAEINNLINWCIIIRFERFDKQVEVSCWYNSESFVTKFNLIKGDSELFDKIVKLIQETYLGSVEE